MADGKKKFRTVWNGNTKGNGRIEANNLETTIAISEGSGGSGEGTGPKELLVSSAAACYIMTLVAILETRNLPVVQLTMDSEASISKQEGFKIIHNPNIVLSAGATEEQIQTTNRAIQSADKGCAIGKMLKRADVQIDILGNVSVQSGQGV
ncbi:OsmC family protein [Mesobacillus foraminis]|uniref:OsmC family protein n=1 Tax=Mesobacillus foraminis TaxID=279826 RepID=UPI000EF4437B|nr:OsmC family protein [Mesobacillus foraminis]